jgi:methylenetetrahydrofolate reductase (NADPH)
VKDELNAFLHAEPAEGGFTVAVKDVIDVAGTRTTAASAILRDHVANRNAAVVERLRAAGASDVLVMAGDAEEPAGEFDGSLPLLEALAELGQPFREVGITGYPESHAFIADDATIKAMFAKEDFATYIVSQICFDPEVTAAWIGAVWERGTKLPVHIGLPGPVPRAKLFEISERIGVGDSLRLLDAGDGDFDPDSLVRGLAETLGEQRPNVGGFHIFTFNELEGTERWRQSALEHALTEG